MKDRIRLEMGQVAVGTTKILVGEGENERDIVADLGVRAIEIEGSTDDATQVVLRCSAPKHVAIEVFPQCVTIVVEHQHLPSPYLLAKIIEEYAKLTTQKEPLDRADDELLVARARRNYALRLAAIIWQQRVRETTHVGLRDKYREFVNTDEPISQEVAEELIGIHREIGDSKRTEQ